ncbi:MAG: hypothetical protein SGPRY_008848, partial [Prymnesium sp.]
VAELDEDAGPLEATIVHLKREVGEKMSENSELQRSWIKAQTELVAIANANQSVSEALHDKRAKASILMSKQRRLVSQTELHNKEVSKLERGNSNLHIELSKVNQLLAEHQSRQKLLVDDNFLMEAEFVEKLKTLEGEAVGAEGQIVELKAQKERLLLDVVEAEKQIMLIEKKIALERETQAALDPEVGAAEVKRPRKGNGGECKGQDLAIALKWARAFLQVRAMQREIHRMRLRYAQLQRRQEQMITEMERAIYKRDNIEAKGKLSAAKKGAAPTHASLNKEISELKAKLSGALHDSGVAAAAVASLQGAHAAEGEKLGEAGARLSEAKAHSARLDQTINGHQVYLQSKHLSKYSRLVRTLVAAAEGVHTPPAGEEVLSEQLGESRDVARRLATLVESLSAEFVQHSPMLNLLLQPSSVEVE